MPFECRLAFGALRFGQGARHRGRDLPALAAAAAITDAEIASFAYVPEWVALAVHWQAVSP